MTYLRNRRRQIARLSKSQAFLRKSQVGTKFNETQAPQTEKKVTQEAEIEEVE
jgi:hypothetical protein